MRFLRIASSLGFFLLCGAAGAQQAPADIQNIDDNVVNIWVRLCVGGGHVEALTGGGTGGADISLRSLDVKGHLAGEVTVSKSSAEGLVQGIDNAMNQVAAAEADKVRVCLQPVRERLLDILLPAPKVAEQLEEAKKRVAEAEAKNQPRYLKGDQKRQFTATLLSDAGYSVAIVSGMLDHEAAGFADDFLEPFKEGKWTVSPRVKNWVRPEDGVTIGKVDEKVLPGENTLDAALTSANIKHSTKQITGDDTRAISPWFTSGMLYLLIGPKPRAEIQ